MMDFLDKELLQIKQKGLLRSLKSRGSSQGSEIEVDGKKVLNFCSNDYLGLASDPRLQEAAVAALHKYGAGSGAARLISGNYDLYDELESKLAAFKGTESALLFNSGYHANIGAIPALAREGDLIFSDELNHASLIDGCRLSKAQTLVYRHNDLEVLKKLLEKTPLPSAGEGRVRGKRLIVTESIFSMEGDLCPLEELLELAVKYDVIVYLDEAHAVGVLGKQGGGLAPKNPTPRLIAMGTLGKAFGSYGAFVAGSRVLRAYLINKARAFIFTTALPPAAVGASLAALKIIQEESARRDRLWANIKKIESPVRAYCNTPLQSPIVSLKIGPADKTMEISQKLFEEGIYLQGIRPPTVPEGTSRLRLTVTSEHTPAQIDRLGDALKKLL